MSHFTTLKTTMKNYEILKQTLEELGFTHNQSLNLIRGYAGGKTQCDIVFSNPTSNYDIGIKQDGNSYSLMGDWWGLRHATRNNNIQTQIKQSYQKNLIMNVARRKGYNVHSTKINNKGEMELTLRRY